MQPDAKDGIPAALVGADPDAAEDRSFDYVVVDTSPAFDEYVLQAFDETDELLLVTTLDVPTLKNVKVAVETLDLLNFPRPQRHLVLNRADDKVGLTAGQGGEHPRHAHRRRHPDVQPGGRTRRTPASPSSAPSRKHSGQPGHHAGSPARIAASGDRDALPSRAGARTHSAAAKRSLLRRKELDHEQPRRPPRSGVPRPRAPPPPRRTDAMSTMSERRRRARDEGRERLLRRSRPRCTTPLLQQLGPKLYDAELTQTELEHMVKGALQDAMQAEDILLTTAERTRISQEIADDILGYGPIEPFLRDPDLTEVMVNGPDSIYIERGGRLVKVEGSFNDEAAPAPHDRQDRVPDRPSRRRVEPDGGRPPARRQPRERGHPAAGRRRLAADDPQVLRRPVHLRRPGRVRHLLPAHRRLPGRLRARAG